MRRLGAALKGTAPGPSRMGLGLEHRSDIQQKAARQVPARKNGAAGFPAAPFCRYGCQPWPLATKPFTSSIAEVKRAFSTPSASAFDFWISSLISRMLPTAFS